MGTALRNSEDGEKKPPVPSLYCQIEAIISTTGQTAFG